MIVSEGTGEFSLNGVATQVKASDMVFAESNVLHGVRNTGQNVDDILFHQDDGEERLIGVVVHGQGT